MKPGDLVHWYYYDGFVIANDPTIVIVYRNLDYPNPWAALAESDDWSVGPSDGPAHNCNI